MASTQVTLAANAITPVALDAPTGRIVVTLLAAGTAYVTTDGTAPVIPSGGVEIPSGQQVISGVAGQQFVVQPRLYGDHMAVPTLQFLSAGTPGISIAW